MAARSGIKKLSQYGGGFSRSALNSLVDNPENLTLPDILMLALFTFATLTFVKGIFFLFTFLFRFSLSLFLIIGVSFFCISIIWLVTLF